MCIATLASRLPRCAHTPVSCATRSRCIGSGGRIGSGRSATFVTMSLTQWIIRDLENVRRAVALEYQPSEVTDV